MTRIGWQAQRTLLFIRQMVWCQPASVRFNFAHIICECGRYGTPSEPQPRWVSMYAQVFVRATLAFWCLSWFMCAPTRRVFSNYDFDMILFHLGLVRSFVRSYVLSHLIITLEANCFSTAPFSADGLPTHQISVVATTILPNEQYIPI